MSDNYEYDEIDEKAKLFAIMELNEVPSQVNDHIDRLRKWVISMPHLHCPTDAKFLLRFLRVSKYDHQKAQRMLDNFCTVRSSQRGSPNLFKYFNLDDPMVDKFLGLQYFIPLGKTDSGECVAMFKTKNCGVDIFTLSDLMILTNMVTDVLLSEEETQIFGFKSFEDLEGVTPKMLEYFENPKMIAQLFTILQNYLPLRIKAQVFFHEPSVFQHYEEKAFPYMKQWLINRTFHFGEDTKTSIEKVKEIMPGVEKILPTEYGGHGGTLEQCAEKWSKKFKSYFKNGDPLSSIHVDESKRPKETLKYFVDYESL